MMGWKLECCTRFHLGLGKAEEVDMTTEAVDMTTEAPLEPTEEVASPKPATKKKLSSPTIIPVTSNEQLKNQNVLVFECPDREKFGNFVGRHQSVKAGGLEPNRMKMNFTPLHSCFSSAWRDVARTLLTLLDQNPITKCSWTKKIS
jgi:hypothetical protein